MRLGDGILCKERRAGGPVGKPTCLWEDGVYLGVKATIGEFIVGDQRGTWLTRKVRNEYSEERSMESRQFEHGHRSTLEKE